MDCDGDSRTLSLWGWGGHRTPCMLCSCQGSKPAPIWRKFWYVLTNITKEKLTQNVLKDNSPDSYLTELIEQLHQHQTRSRQMFLKRCKAIISLADINGSYFFSNLNIQPQISWQDGSPHSTQMPPWSPRPCLHCTHCADDCPGAWCCQCWGCACVMSPQLLLLTAASLTLALSPLSSSLSTQTLWASLQQSHLHNFFRIL